MALEAVFPEGLSPERAGALSGMFAHIHGENLRCRDERHAWDLEQAKKKAAADAERKKNERRGRI